MSKIKQIYEDIIESVENDDMAGFCVSCFHKQYGVEPDARRYECEECGEYSVYGAEELLIRYG